MLTKQDYRELLSLGVDPHTAINAILVSSKSKTSMLIEWADARDESKLLETYNKIASLDSEFVFRNVFVGRDLLVFHVDMESRVIETLETNQQRDAVGILLDFFCPGDLSADTVITYLLLSKTPVQISSEMCFAQTLPTEKEIQSKKVKFQTALQKVGFDEVVHVEVIPIAQEVDVLEELKRVPFLNYLRRDIAEEAINLLWNMDAHVSVDLAKKSLDTGVEIPSDLLLKIYQYAKETGRGLYISNYVDASAFEADYVKYKDRVFAYETKILKGFL